MCTIFNGRLPTFMLITLISVDLWWWLVPTIWQCCSFEKNSIFFPVLTTCIVKQGRYHLKWVICTEETCVKFKRRRKKSVLAGDNKCKMSDKEEGDKERIYSCPLCEDKAYTHINALPCACQDLFSLLLVCIAITRYKLHFERVGLFFCVISFFQLALDSRIVFAWTYKGQSLSSWLKLSSRIAHGVRLNLQGTKA